MSGRPWPRHAQFGHRQRGQAMIFVALLLLLGVSAVIYTTVSSTSVSIANLQADVTIRALAQARDALIGRAASDGNRPGSLPCPDLDDGTVNPLNTANDGTTDFYSGNECPGFVAGSNVYLGRLPWRTLGLPDLRDSSGERLWYAVSRDFARNPTCAPNCPLNSDTLGQLTVTGVAPASNVVAIIFAAGTSLGTQARDAAGVNTASNYLEDENANGNNSIFTTQASSTTFNDRLLAITNADLMPVVEQRVARGLRKILQDYKANTVCACTNLGGTPGCYPWADLSDGYSDAPPWWPVGEGRNRGRIPALGAAPYDWGATPCGTGPLAVPTLPSWFVNNDWRLVVYYSAGQNYLGPGVCSTCTATTLTVDATSKELVILMPGPLLAAPPRAPVALNDSTYWSYYFEDAANQDFANDVYVTPTSTAFTRDRIFTIP